MMLVVPGEFAGKIETLGLPNCVWLKVLNMSTRKFSVYLSLKKTFFAMEVSTFEKPGPIIDLRMAFPKSRDRHRMGGAEGAQGGLRAPRPAPHGTHREAWRLLHSEKHGTGPDVSLDTSPV